MLRISSVLRIRQIKYPAASSGYLALNSYLKVLYAARPMIMLFHIQQNRASLLSSADNDLFIDPFFQLLHV